MPNLPISGKIEATIEGRSVDKLIDAVVDTFSPATELAGLLGDTVRLARVEVAAKITRKAKEIAENNNLELIAPPIKFLAPFYEKSSLEEDEILQDVWAELLVSAGSNENANHNRYISIISELSSNHLLALENVVGNCRSFRDLENIKDYVYDATLPNAIESLKVIEREAKDKSAILDSIIHEYDKNGSLLIYIALASNDNKIYYDYSGEKYDHGKEIIYEALRSLGLIERVDTGFVATISWGIFLQYYVLTALGVDFYRATHSFSVDKM